MFTFCRPTDKFDGNGISLITERYIVQILHMFSGMNYVWQSGTVCNQFISKFGEPVVNAGYGSTRNEWTNEWMTLLLSCEHDT